ncbi:MAG: hypothetical protein Q4A01_04130 [Coriobacteriales bacterium]|nr:hypothetical protein [Coriobacteriales bacterium]
MARVNLANEHHGTVWVCQTCTFSEGDLREFDAPVVHAAFATRTEAMGWAMGLACDYTGVLAHFVAVDGSDGISVEVVPRIYEGHAYDERAITNSWEVVPGRPVTDWHGIDCRDNGRPEVWEVTP